MKGLTRLDASEEKNEKKKDVNGTACLGGRDAQDPVGGTWLGLSLSSTPKDRKGGQKGRKMLRIGALTNIHDEGQGQGGKKKSRGALVKDYLLLAPDHPDKGKDSDAKAATDAYLRGLEDDKDLYAGYNLLLFDAEFPSTSSAGSNNHDPTVVARYFSNRSEPRSLSALAGQLLSPARSHGPAPTYVVNTTAELTYEEDAVGSGSAGTLCRGLSNSLLNDPFPKVKEGVKKMEEILADAAQGTRVVGGNDVDRKGEERREEGTNEEELVERLFGLLG